MHIGWVAAALSASTLGFAAGTSSTPDLSKCHGYSVSNVVEEPWKIQADLDLVGKGCGVYGPDVAQLRLLVEYQTDSRLHVLIKDRQGLRHRVPENVFPRPISAPPASKSASLLSLEFASNPFSFKVTRKSSGEVLFDTAGNNLIFERQFLRIRTNLPSDPNIYGLGEHIDSFRLPNKNYMRTLWARDAGGVPYGENLYGSHPIYHEHRETGTHGVLLMNSNGMDIKLDQDDDGVYFLEYAVIGGVLDFYFLAGPGPIDVTQQYAALVGLPALVPYWSLGFHQCRYGYQDWFNVAEVVHNYSAAGIPLETMWTDIDYMDRRRTFSFDPERFPIERMQQLVHYLHSRHQRYMVMVDPAVGESEYPAYQRGIEMDTFLKNSSNSGPFRGVVWPGVAVFPDWTHANATAYWAERFEETFNPKDGVDIDGVWIDMNEPANFCQFPCDDPEAQAKEQGNPPEPPPVRDPPRSIPGFPAPDKADAVSGTFSSHDISEYSEHEQRSANSGEMRSPTEHDGDNLLSPPYRIHNAEGNLSAKTAHTDLRLANGEWLYDEHNLYGTSMSMMTQKAMLLRRPGLRTFIITRSTFAGAGRYVSKWLGDNLATWDHYRSSISGMLSFASIFQVPMVGSDVCGFIGATTETLCARWTTLGAFGPFYRNHNDLGFPSQEFYRWKSVTAAAKYAISWRYRLLDYFYTALEKQSDDGTPAVSPLWYFYPQDKDTFPIDLQYFYGDCILVSPVTEEGATDVSIYLPDDIFYDLETQKAVRGRGNWVDVKDVPLDRIPLHVRGGCVVPLRSESANTTTELRQKGFELLVAPGLDGTARGSLYVDDGVTLDGGPNRVTVEFEYARGQVKTTIMSGSASLSEAGIEIEKVTIMGETTGRDDEDYSRGEL